jgi:hypothetical protein
LLLASFQSNPQKSLFRSSDADMGESVGRLVGTTASSSCPAEAMSPAWYSALTIALISQLGFTVSTLTKHISPLGHSWLVPDLHHVLLEQLSAACEKVAPQK